MEPRPRQRGGRGGYGGGPPAGGLAGAEVPVVENICADGLCQQAELDRAFAALQAHRGWSDFTTTHGCVRLFDQWLCERALPLVAAAASGAPIPEGGRADAGDALWAPVPVAFEFLRPVLRGAVGALRRCHGPGAVLVPIKVFLCLYPDGESSCPRHRHDCRQLTLSLGAPRTLRVGGRRLLMRAGDYVILRGAEHDVPQLGPGDPPCGPRASVNIFYALIEDFKQGPVAVKSGARRGAELLGRLRADEVRVAERFGLADRGTRWWRDDSRVARSARRGRQ
eukprot:TRINITY_DN41165_c0_g1_i1.p2 TRINITY_DN41165_c0_g1~~TRINITY_DN41165_c0_g1_i1.p2  ORF type:complete len:281 (+),score=45.09 TRINITY_DN41165_c0_g1_i1:66-908(+)